MTNRTLREKIEALVASAKDDDDVMFNRAIYQVLDILDAHTAAQPAPDAVAEAAKALLADDIAISRMAEAIHDGPLGADDYWFSAARPQGAWCVEVARAGLSALAKGPSS